MPKTIWKQEDEIRALEMLNAFFNKTNTVYTVLYHVSKSGMSRWLKLYTCVDNQIVNITWPTAVILEEKLEEDGTIKVKGVGTDVGFETVYNLSYKLYKDGYKLNHKWL